MRLFDQAFLLKLHHQFRCSMRGLLSELCDELERSYPEASRRLRLPVSLIRLTATAMPLQAYSHWRVVGWIETLNELIYFIDLHQQARRTGPDLDFIEQLYAECQHTWYEHGYEEEIFPHGAVSDGRLTQRIGRLCRRLACDVAQQTLLWDPSLACQWLRQTGYRTWRTPCTIEPNFDRADLPFALPVGVEDMVYQAPPAVRETLRSAETALFFVLKHRELGVACKEHYIPLYEVGPPPRWHWWRQAPILLRQTPLGKLTLGPTLMYGRRRLPARIYRTAPHVAAKMRRALAVIEQAWPIGNWMLALLTSRIVPLKARGVVSFSYRHQPGLSFINCFDRDRLDLVDDLVHENSHHHLNLLLRKYVLYRDGENKEIFYSPWRRALRPVRGILHATFTFAVGAMLFERLCAWASGPDGRRRWHGAGFTRKDLDRARIRCLEEIDSVRYSLGDLRDARRRFGWITKTGEELLDALARRLSAVSRRMRDEAAAVARSSSGVALERHRAELLAARKRHGRVISRAPSSNKSTIARHG